MVGLITISLRARNCRFGGKEVDVAIALCRYDVIANSMNSIQ